MYGEERELPAGSSRRRKSNNGQDMIGYEMMFISEE